MTKWNLDIVLPKDLENDISVSKHLEEWCKLHDKAKLEAEGAKVTLK